MWIEACVEDECQAGQSKVVTIMCEHKCSDGTCLHWNAKCNYVRECPDGSDEQVKNREKIRETLFTFKIHSEKFFHFDDFFSRKKS